MTQKDFINYSEKLVQMVILIDTSDSKKETHSK